MQFSDKSGQETLLVVMGLSWRGQSVLLTLSVHAREGYSSHFVCLSACFFIVEKAG